MHIELIDTLRCPNVHEETWLVGAFDRVVDRDIVEGRLGCPVCGATYPVTGGIVQFDPAPRDDPAPASDAAVPPVGAEDALRLAAMLDLASPGGLVVLEGAWALAGAMLETFIDARLLVLNPPAAAAEGSGASGMRASARMPVAAGSCRGIALHRSSRADVLARAAVAALRPGGRLVAPAGVSVPDDVRELARDAMWWVAERSAPPPSLVELRRGQ